MSGRYPPGSGTKVVSNIGDFVRMAADEYRMDGCVFALRKGVLDVVKGRRMG